MTSDEPIDSTPQPHDALFQWVFSQPKHAIGLLKAVLPQALSDAIDQTTLHHMPGSFIDDALRKRHSDVALTARVGDSSMILYFVAEQQRDPDDIMPWRFLVYKTRIWEKLLRQAPRRKRLPPIVPILVYNNDKSWQAATAFHDIIEQAGLNTAAQAALKPYVPQFELRMVDLNGRQADVVVNEALTALGQVALWCMAVAGDNARFEREIGRIGKALDEILLAADGFAALGVILRYLAMTHVGLDAAKVGELLEKAAGPRAQEVVVTFLDEIEQRGERRGERKGRAETLLEQLAVRFGALSNAIRDRVMAADQAALSEWTLRVLTAPTLADVLDSNTPKPSAPKSTAARKRARRT